MSNPKRGLTKRQLMDYLATHAPCGYQCFAFQISSDGLWYPGVSIILEGAAVSGLDIRQTFPSHDTALAAAYNAARERERLIWTSESVRPASKN